MKYYMTKDLFYRGIFIRYVAIYLLCGLNLALACEYINSTMVTLCKLILEHGMG